MATSGSGTPRMLTPAQQECILNARRAELGSVGALMRHPQPEAPPKVPRGAILVDPSRVGISAAIAAAGGGEHQSLAGLPPEAVEARAAQPPRSSSAGSRGRRISGAFRTAPRCRMQAPGPGAMNRELSAKQPHPPALAGGYPPLAIPTPTRAPPRPNMGKGGYPSNRPESARAAALALAPEALQRLATAVSRSNDPPSAASAAASGFAAAAAAAAAGDDRVPAWPRSASQGASRDDHRQGEASAEHREGARRCSSSSSKEGASRPISAIRRSASRGVSGSEAAMAHPNNTRPGRPPARAPSHDVVEADGGGPAGSRPPSTTASACAGRPPLNRAGGTPMMANGAARPRSRDSSGVPRYLQRIKAEIAAEEKLIAEKLGLKKEAPGVPPGCVELAESQRNETLFRLRRRLEDLESQHRQLPLRLETPGQRQRAEDLEKELKLVEQDIVSFSRPRVFVRI
mmetsp:Transcript_47250/g.101718  ORF Transcript_47250/g.101718 Transcript_47250/m.101718 type:complete len:459 (-) Transcript_47250:201-1577(-)